MESVFEVLYYKAYKDKNDNVCTDGDIYLVGIFSSLENAKKAIEEDKYDLGDKIVENESYVVGKFHLYDGDELVGFYDITDIELDKITNKAICEF